MKVLVIGGNRYVGLRLVHALDPLPDVELHVLNRTGQVAHAKNAVIYKSDRADLSQLDRDFDLIYDFAAYTAADAAGAIHHFGRVGRYIFISTVSVYDQGGERFEKDFDAERWSLTTAGQGYQYGKRAAEATFAQRAPFPVLSVRFPVIAGPDDYSHRLDFHIERAQRGEPVYATNADAHFSLIHSADAAAFLAHARTVPLQGPLNVASPAPITLRHLAAQIELATGHRLTLLKPSSSGPDEGISPYSPDADWFVNTDRLQATGFRVRPIANWLPELLGPLPNQPRGRLH